VTFEHKDLSTTGAQVGGTPETDNKSDRHEGCYRLRATALAALDASVKFKPVSQGSVSKT